MQFHKITVSGAVLAMGLAAAALAQRLHGPRLDGFPALAARGDKYD